MAVMAGGEKSLSHQSFMLSAKSPHAGTISSPNDHCVIAVSAGCAVSSHHVGMPSKKPSTLGATKLPSVHVNTDFRRSYAFAP